jgi:hypothetical protein
MNKIVQVGWENTNNRVSIVLICKAERTRLGIKLASECANPMAPFENVIKISTNRGGISSSQFALANLQFKQHIADHEAVTVNEKLADMLDLAIGSEVTLEKSTQQEAEGFFEELAESFNR